MNNEIILREGNVRRACFRTTRIRPILGICVVAFLLAGILIWLLLIPIPVVTVGYCCPSHRSARFFFPVGGEDMIPVGAEIRVGNAIGTVFFHDDGYISADMLEHSGSADVASFSQSRFFEPDVTYRSGVAMFDTEIAGADEYSVTLGEYKIGEVIYDLFRYQLSE